MIFGITGNKRHGKDTLARAVQHLDPEYQILHFAGPLKEIAQEVYLLTHAQCHDDAAKEFPFAHPINLDDGLGMLRALVGEAVQPRGLVARTPRQLMQYLGTDYVRSVYPTFWIDKVAERLNLIRHHGTGKALVPDLRFHNEAATIRAAFGMIVRVVRVDFPVSTDPHESERQIAELREDIRVEHATEPSKEAGFQKMVAHARALLRFA